MTLEWNHRELGRIGSGLLVARGEPELADSYFRAVDLLVFGPEPIFILGSEVRFHRQSSMTLQPRMRRGELTLPGVLAAGDRVEVLSTDALIRALPDEVAAAGTEGAGARLKVGPSAATLDLRIDLVTVGGVETWRQRLWVGWDEQAGVLLQFLESR